MSFEYLASDSGRSFLLSYESLKQDYYRYVSMSDVEFQQHIVGALHLACVICFLKEAGTYCLSDEGIIHELVHLLPGSSGTTTSLQEIRESFRKVCELA
jgi:hypothetical protein